MDSRAQQPRRHCSRPHRESAPFTPCAWPTRLWTTCAAASSRKPWTTGVAMVSLSMRSAAKSSSSTSGLATGARPASRQGWRRAIPLASRCHLPGQGAVTRGVRHNVGSPGLPLSGALLRALSCRPGPRARPARRNGPAVGARTPRLAPHGLVQQAHRRHEPADQEDQARRRHASATSRTIASGCCCPPASNGGTLDQS